LGHFVYKAVDRNGAEVSGTIEAADRRSAVVMLAEKGHFVTELAEKARAASQQVEQAGRLQLGRLAQLGRSRVSSKDILAITSQLSTALQAGLPLLNVLELIEQQQTKPAVKALLTELAEAVSSGQSLSEAMSKYPEVFSPLYVSMVRVGETGGILEKTTAQLAQILRRDEKIKTSMKNASAYPIFVLCLGMVSVTIIITWILPRILTTISGGGVLLPWPTRILMGMSHLAKGLLTTLPGWGLMAAAVGAVYAFRKWTRSKGRLEWDAFKLKVPILGSVLQTIAVGRFARTLGSLTSGGVTILEALSVVRDTLGNEVLAKEIDQVADKVKKGSSLAEPLAESGRFPPLLVQITAIGEQTGKLDELLLNAADTFDSDADAAINRFMSIFPAIMILLLAVVIGFIIVATLLPILVMQLGAGVF